MICGVYGRLIFLEVLDKHAPRRVKRLRNKANIPWVNGDERQNYQKEML